jgi:acyl dehydratase
MDIRQTRAFGGVKVGDELPPITIALSHTGVAAAAIATRDFQPIHHDVERARALGSANVFINTYTTAGYLERLVVEWAGRDVLMRKISFRMGVPSYAGDTMVVKGKVTALRKDERCVEIEVTGSNSLGDHAVGTVVAQLP